MIAFGISEKGNYRNENQDSILIRNRGNSGLFLVADGVGGSKEGSKASSLITEQYAIWWNEVFRNAGGGDFFPLFNGIKETAERINRELCHCYGPGRSCSTLVLLFIHKGIFGYLSSGDSRIYQYNRKGARLITRDDVWENRPDADLQSGNEGKIISAVGGYERLEYSCVTDKVKIGEVFMLCSDGIYRFVEEQVMASALKKMYKGLFFKKHVVEELARAAVENDTKDNYSLIAVKV